MLEIIRTRPNDLSGSCYLEATVRFHPHGIKDPKYPDLVFRISTYDKISKISSEKVGDAIMSPIQTLFKELDAGAQTKLYEMYSYCLNRIRETNLENRRKTQIAMRDEITRTLRQIKLARILIDYCSGDQFTYPDPSQFGHAPHHTKEQTYLLNDYIEVTAICLLSKVMVPIFGEYIAQLGQIEIDAKQREGFALDLIEPTLEEQPLTRIYEKLTYTLTKLVADTRADIDTHSQGGSNTAYILSHNGIDTKGFERSIMAAIIVKKMGSYESLGLRRNGTIPNALAYINDGISRTTSTRISSMRTSTKIMPRRELPSHNIEDNTSIIDHSAKPSRRTIDVPIFVQTGAANWELARFLYDTETDADVWEKVVHYYEHSPYDVNPLTTCLMASFIGTRFGGSRCLSYLTAPIYQKYVAILQIWLIKNGMVDLASMIVSSTPDDLSEKPVSTIGMRISANKESEEYQRCQSLFVGYATKPQVPFGRKVTSKKPKSERIDFVTLIDRLIEWITRYDHFDNTAPVLWKLAGIEDGPAVGMPCRYDETIIRDVCRFFLIFHSGTRPF